MLSLERGVFFSLCNWATRSNADARSGCGGFTDR